MASGPITSWDIDGETVETVSDFIFLGSKITADGYCSHEIKRCLLLGRKVMTNPDSILKSRDITLPKKVRLVKAMVFPVVMYGLRIGLWRKLSAKKLMLLNCGVGEDSWESLGLQGDPTSPSWRRKVLGVHWKDRCWSWNSNALATSCERLTHWKRPWCLEGLGAGREGDDRGWDDWMASPTQWAWGWVNSRSLWWTGRPVVLWFIGSQRVGHNSVTKLNWTDWYFWNNAMVVNLLLTRACNDRTIYLATHGKVLAKPSPKIQRILWIPPDDCFIRPIMLTFYHLSWFSVLNIHLRVII